MNGLEIVGLVMGILSLLLPIKEELRRCRRNDQEGLLKRSVQHPQSFCFDGSPK